MSVCEGWGGGGVGTAMGIKINLLEFYGLIAKIT